MYPLTLHLIYIFYFKVNVLNSNIEELNNVLIFLRSFFLIQISTTKGELLDLIMNTQKMYEI
jgi:hypothetical protein